MTASVFLRTESSPVNWTCGYAIANGSNGIPHQVPTSITVSHGFRTVMLRFLSTCCNSSASQICFTKIPSSSRIADRFNT